MAVGVPVSARAKLGIGAFRASNRTRQMAAEINNVAMNYVDLGDLDGALETARDAVERARDVHAADLEAMAHSTLARVYLDRDELDAARREAEAAEALAPSEEALSGIEGWKTLAEIADRSGRPERADVLYRRALDTLREVGRHTAFAETARAYSRLLQRQGDTERALAIALEALDAGGASR